MNQNYLLFMPSLMQDNRAPIDYTVKGAYSDLVFTAAQTNIPATQYIIHVLAGRLEKLQKIILLCSKEVLTTKVVCPGVHEPMTTYDYYVRTVSEWMEKYGYLPEEIENAFFCLNLEDINPGSYRSMNSVRTKIQEQFIGDGCKHLYLDYTGGLRNTSMMLIMFARMLEIDGIAVKEVLYSSIYHGQGEIESCMDTYHLFNYLDAYAAAKAGNLDLLLQLAFDDGDLELAHEIEKTQTSKNIIEYRKVDKENNVELDIDESMDITKKQTIRIVNEQRKNLTLFGLLKDKMAKGDVSGAIKIVREKGLQILSDSGYLKWAYKRDDPGADTEIEIKGDEYKAFYAYICYYRSYLTFVCSMLKELKDVSDPITLKSSCKQYYIDHTQLTRYSGFPVKNSLIDFQNEFATFCKKRKEQNTEQKFEQGLLPRIAQMYAPGSISDEQIRATQAYKDASHPYLTTYCTKGFPFGNLYPPANPEISFSRKYGKFCNVAYYISLWQCIENLSKIPEEERANIIQTACEYAEDTRSSAILIPSVLTEAFPMVEFEGLFTLRDNDFVHLGEPLIIMDRVGKLRNLTTHEWNKINDKNLSEGSALVSRFIAWVESIISADEEQ